MPGVVALVLLAAFTVVLVRAQARTCRACASVPRVSTRRSGRGAIVRNGVLAGLAVLAIGDPAGANVVGDRRLVRRVRRRSPLVAVRAAH